MSKLTDIFSRHIERNSIIMDEHPENLTIEQCHKKINIQLNKKNKKTFIL